MGHDDELGLPGYDEWKTRSDRDEMPDEVGDADEPEEDPMPDKLEQIRHEAEDAQLGHDVSLGAGKAFDLIERLARELQATNRVLQSRTEHLA